MRVWIPLLLLATLAHCGSPRQAPPPPASRPAAPATSEPVPAPPPAAANWEDLPATPGDWTYARDQRGSVAMFGKPGADADFLIRCAIETRRIYVSRAGQLAGGESGRIILRATSALQAYPLANSNSTPPYVAAELAATDRHLDALAFSRGRFLVSVRGVPDLVIPAWPEFSRVVEDCRS